MTDLLSAVALLLILEGIMPFLYPSGLRQWFLTLSEMEDGKLRFLGLTSMVVGVVLLSLIR